MKRLAKRLLSLLAGLAALLLLYLIDEWLFSRWLGVHYWRWYLRNASLIGLVSAIVLKIWGNGADKHLGLISSHPLTYLGSWLQYVGLPFYSLGTQLRRNRDQSIARSGIDLVLALAWMLILAPVLLVWFIVIVPLQFLVYFICGGPIRYAMDSDRLTLARFAQNGSRLEIDEADKYSYSLLLLRDLKDGPSLVLKLIEARDPLSAWLREHLSTDLIEDLTKEKNSRPLPPPLLQSLLNELNPLLRGDTIYEKERFKEVALTEKLRRAVDKSDQADQKTRLNRSLIQEAYPDEITPGFADEQSDGWWDASFSRNPVSMTNALGALLMWIVQNYLRS
jgi:hypothetical protein